MTDDLVRAQEELDEHAQMWGENREMMLLRRVLRLLAGKARGPNIRVVTGRPSWRPANGEPCIDRIDATLYVGFDGQWYSTQLTPMEAPDGA